MLTHTLGDTYTFERELHGGGMSRVFVALDRSLGRKVAVKVLSRDVSAEVKTERFRLEIQLAAKLSHPHIVPLLQYGDINGILYYTMPFVQGESLRAMIDRDGALPIPDAIRVLRHVASAISYAHRHGVVHRDIKPDNVLIADEFALVTDFGISRALSASATPGDEPSTRLTTSGMALGTPAYMAPEQALADPTIDHRADIYSFGILAYEVLTGAPPFKSATAQATLAAHVVQPPDPIESKRADIPPTVAAMVMKCIEKKPDDRPQSAAELLPVLDATSTPRSGETQRTDALPSAIRQEKPRRRWIPIASVVGLLIIAAVAITEFRSIGSSADAGFSSVAVLPLENLGNNKADEYFSDGLTDELANALGKLPGLKVASRSSAYAYKGSTADVSEIGRKLHVQAVLEGTVRRDGNKLRITAALSSVKDGLSLWSDSYDREVSDIFKLQDEIAEKIAEQLKPKLGDRAETKTLSTDARGTNNRVAYDNYLRGIYFLNRRGGDNLRLAVEYLDSAIAIDPSFARAYSAKATSQALLPEYTDAVPKNISTLARESAARALELDSTQAEAYTALGLVNVHDWRFEDAGRAYRKALELKPDYPTAHQWYGELLFHTGKLDSSLVQIQRAVDLDPLAPINGSAIGYVLLVRRDFSRAIAETRKGIEVAPSLGLHHVLLGEALMQSGHVKEGVPEIEAGARLDHELALRQGQLANAYAIAGRTAEATRIVDSLEAIQRAHGGIPVAVATGYIGLRNYSRALDYLEEAAKAHDMSLVTAQSLLPDPIYDPLRSDPRFIAILKEMNLLSYAQAMKRPKH